MIFSLYICPQRKKKFSWKLIYIKGTQFKLKKNINSSYLDPFFPRHFSNNTNIQNYLAFISRTSNFSIWTKINWIIDE